MSTEIAPTAHPVVSLVDGRAVTTSHEIARIFGKPHHRVLWAIRLLLEKLDGKGLSNFCEGSYTLPETGEQQHPNYTMTRDGFVLLAMGFSGKRALEFKLAYIAEFNRMEAELRARPPAELTNDDYRELERAYIRDRYLPTLWSHSAGLATESHLFEELLQGNEHPRCLVSFLNRASGDREARVQAIDPDAFIGTMAQLIEAITDPGGLAPSDAELAELAKACTNRLIGRLRNRGGGPAAASGQLTTARNRRRQP